MKKRISIILSVAFILSLSITAFAQPFSDVVGHWAESEIELAYNNKIINGDELGNFNPDTLISRAEFVKMLSVVCANDLGETIQDVENPDHWVSRYYTYIKNSILTQKELESVIYFSGTEITPGVINKSTADIPIERWEMAYLIWAKISTYIQPSVAMANKFLDVENMKIYNENIQNSIINCNYLGVVLGDENNNFNAGFTGTRSEGVTMINRLDKLLVDIKAQFGIVNTPKTEFTTKIDESITHESVQVEMENGGKFTIELYPEYAPKTVENFLKLVNKGFYNGLTFHRIVKDFVAQGGDPLGTGAGGSDETIVGEFATNGFTQNNFSHQRGVVSMARSAENNSASSQFFICYGDASFLDGSYAAFGKVIEGMEVVDAFLKVEMATGDLGEASSPVTPIKIKTITVIKK